jgi:hypothetical protein
MTVRLSPIDELSTLQMVSCLSPNLEEAVAGIRMNIDNPIQHDDAEASLGDSKYAH